MTINNIELIKPLLHWEDLNDFYFVQLLKRKKENPDFHANSAVVATYYIGSPESLDKKFPEMKLLAKFHNARVYINLNRRNYERLGLQMIKKVSECLINKAYKDVNFISSPDIQKNNLTLLYYSDEAINIPETMP